MYIHVCHSITIISYYERLVIYMVNSNTPTLNNPTIYVLKMKETPAPALQQVADLWCFLASSRSPCSSLSVAAYNIIIVIV